MILWSILIKNVPGKRIFGNRSSAKSSSTVDYNEQTDTAFVWLIIVGARYKMRPGAFCFHYIELQFNLKLLLMVLSLVSLVDSILIVYNIYYKYVSLW